MMASLVGGAWYLPCVTMKNKVAARMSTKDECSCSSGFHDFRLEFAFGAMQSQWCTGTDGFGGYDWKNRRVSDQPFGSRLILPKMYLLYNFVYV
jgi:hypothetical protein